MYASVVCFVGQWKETLYCMIPPTVVAFFLASVPLSWKRKVTFRVLTSPHCFDLNGFLLLDDFEKKMRLV